MLEPVHRSSTHLLYVPDEGGNQKHLVWQSGIALDHSVWQSGIALDHSVAIRHRSRPEGWLHCFLRAVVSTRSADLLFSRAS